MDVSGYGQLRYLTKIKGGFMFKKIIPICFMIITLLNISCSSGPSEGDIKEAVITSLQNHVPPSLARYLTGGNNAIIDKVKVIQIGSAQGEGTHTYWPVKIYAKGSCDLMFGGRKDFAGETEYILRLDAYDNWQASPKGF